MSTTAGAIRGESTPRPASRPSLVRRPPSCRLETPLLRRGEASPSRLAVGRAGGVGTGDQLSRSRVLSPRLTRLAVPIPAGSRSRPTQDAAITTNMKTKRIVLLPTVNEDMECRGKTGGCDHVGYSFNDKRGAARGIGLERSKKAFFWKQGRFYRTYAYNRTVLFVE